MASQEVTDAPGAKPTLTELERTTSYEKAQATRLENVDNELSQYIGGDITVSKERSDELRKKIDRRILLVMICTYFLQAIDKGTMSFASVMGLQKDTGLVGQQFSWLTTCIYIVSLHCITLQPTLGP